MNLLYLLYMMMDGTCFSFILCVFHALENSSSDGILVPLKSKICQHMEVEKMRIEQWKNLVEGIYGIILRTYMRIISESIVKDPY